MATIYRKTAEGQAEIETRARQLGPRMRTALIMVDGKRSDEDLQKLIGVQPEQTLQALIELGMIEAVSITVPKPTPKPAAAPAPAAAAPAAPRDFATLRRDAVRAVNDLLGPMGEMIAIKLEGAKTPQELQAALEKAVTIIGNARGGAAAVQFARQFIEAPTA